MSFILLYVTHPSKPEAIRITEELLNAHLIACANYSPIESSYWWKWEIATSSEILTIYKTRTENYEAVKSMIESLHTYEIPCIIKLATAEANESYENWIQSETHTD